MAKNSSENKRTRNWSFIMYPDSVPSNWRDILEEIHTNIIISPLHDRDIDKSSSDENKHKKPHWHVIITFDGVKTLEQVSTLISPLNCTIPVAVQNINGIIRYLIHKDNPEKAQYDKNDIVVIGNYDIDEAFKNSTDRYAAIKDMINYIAKNDVVEYIDFMLYCSLYQEEWFKLLCDNASFVIQGAITSNRNKLKDRAKNQYYIDHEEEITPHYNLYDSENK